MEIGNVRYISHQGNKVAHFLASYALSNSVSCMWTDSLPKFMDCFVWSDLLVNEWKSSLPSKKKEKEKEKRGGGLEWIKYLNNHFYFIYWPTWHKFSIFDQHDTNLVNFRLILYHVDERVSRFVLFRYFSL